MTITFSWHGEGGRHFTTAGRKAAKALQRAGRAAIRPHRKALGNLAHMPLSLAGLASVDFAAFHLAHGWGWLVTGISLIVAELAAADE